MRKPLVASLAACLIGSLAVAAAPASAENIGGDQLALPGVQANLGPAAQPLPKVVARTWLLADATTGQVIAAKKAHKQRHPASTLKTLTALTLLPRLAMDGTFTGTHKAANIYGAKVGVQPKQQYTIEDLFYGMMLPSGNDAAIALAQANGGVNATVAQMNGVAAQLQALDTLAKSPNGLDTPGQVSSAYDLVLIARAGLARADFAAIVSTRRATFPDRAKGKGTGVSRHPIYNLNQLLTNGYKGAVGVKTGFTTKAGRTFVGAANRKGHLLIWAGMGIKESSEAASRKALSWGFKNFDKVTPLGTLVDPISPLPTVGQPLSTQTAAIPVASASATAPTMNPKEARAIQQAALKVPAPAAQAPSWWLGLIAVVIVGALLLGLNAGRNRRRRYR